LWYVRHTKPPIVMKYSITPFFLFLSAYCLHAQDAPVTYNNDVGFNTTFALQGVFNSNQTPFSLMYKKYVAEKRAWRLGVDTYVNINKTDSKTSTSSFTDYSSGYVGLVVGMEKQNQIDKRWVWYYGGDFVPYHSFTNSDSFSNGELFWEEQYKEFGLGLRPFLGIRFDISPRLYLSAEANLLLSYARTKSYASNVNDPIPSRDIEGSHLVVTASPASGLFLYYRF
jgi:hypothetical protein